MEAGEGGRDPEGIIALILLRTTASLGDTGHMPGQQAVTVL